MLKSVACSMLLDRCVQRGTEWTGWNTVAGQRQPLGCLLYWTPWHTNRTATLRILNCDAHRSEDQQTYIQEVQLTLTNPCDAFRGQSRSPKHGTIRCVRYGFLLVFYSNFVPKILRYSTSKNVVTLKHGSEVTQGHRNRHGLIRHLWLPINVT